MVNMTVVTLHTQVTPLCREGPAHTGHFLLPVARNWHLVRDLCSEGAGGRGRQAAGLGGGGVLPKGALEAWVSCMGSSA